MTHPGRKERILGVLVPLAPSPTSRALRARQTRCGLLLHASVYLSVCCCISLQLGASHGPDTSAALPAMMWDGPS